ncbi:hypothetical protein QAD02_005577 [Eretmocerus hayati]|uniref:Uncharacterized protein n=1 Tax=Eretmocerus hayati TaxID=131215 RepID=A0ACC2NSY6_9HYME|nr:hypothetical protein QAD02_005577 [Eretmocerus hayati]
MLSRTPSDWSAIVNVAIAYMLEALSAVRVSPKLSAVAWRSAVAKRRRRVTIIPDPVASGILDTNISSEKKKLPRVRLIGVESNYTNMLNNKIESDICNRNRIVDKDRVKYTSKKTNEAGIILEITADAYSIIMKEKKIFNDCNRCPVYDDLMLNRCFKCKKYNHKSLENCIKSKQKIKNHVVTGDSDINIQSNDIYAGEMLSNFYEMKYDPYFKNPNIFNIKDLVESCIDDANIKIENDFKFHRLKYDLTDHYPIFLEISGRAFIIPERNSDKAQVNSKTFVNLVKNTDWLKILSLEISKRQ